MGETSTSKAKGKVVRCKKRKKHQMFSTTVSTSRALVTPPGGCKGNRKRVHQSTIPNDVDIYCREKGHCKRECPKLLSNE
ncbi:UNVERIFIED_CONTAM: hypothetical protein Sindi_0667600, partial [Sesamum indicum]